MAAGQRLPRFPDDKFVLCSGADWNKAMDLIEKNFPLKGSGIELQQTPTGTLISARTAGNGVNGYLYYLNASSEEVPLIEWQNGLIITAGPVNVAPA